MRDSPPNLLLLDDFCRELDPDGVHFTILAGVNFIQFMVDQAAELIARPPADAVTRYDLFRSLGHCFRFINPSLLG